LSASFASALNAARDAAAAQHYPQGALYIVATPIGNLADITLRALHVLQLADAIACEDTRHTQALLRAYGIDKTSAQLLAVHQHNEAEAALAVVQRLQQGLRVAYVSDAGTPGVSDPGARLVAAVHSAGLRCPAAARCQQHHHGPERGGRRGAQHAKQWLSICGFLPVKNAERATAMQQLASEPRCVVLLEAPHRIDELAQALAVLGDRPVTLARELTKQFEEIATHPARELTAWLQGSPQRSRGEFVVLLHPTAPAADDGDSLRVLRLLLQELPLKTAVRLAAEVTGASRNSLYDTALEWKRSAPEAGNA
jgi:16S rRNA (cytidine1402-2'-O)-methyltransferase